MSDYLKQDTRNENVFVLSLMSGETTPIYFSTYISKMFLIKCWSTVVAIEIHTTRDPVSFWETFIKDQRMALALVHVYLHVLI